MSRVVRTTTELAVWVARYVIPVPREIDNPPTVVETLEGAKVRAWLPAAALSHDDEIELDERRAVKTTPSGEVVTRVWLPVSHAVVRRRRR